MAPIPLKPMKYFRFVSVTVSLIGASAESTIIDAELRIPYIIVK